eukprot:scaffold189697_cov12-Prasinocladus_malaysianus.AAC.1
MNAVRDGERLEGLVLATAARHDARGLEEWVKHHAELLGYGGRLHVVCVGLTGHGVEKVAALVCEWGINVSTSSESGVKQSVTECLLGTSHRPPHETKED